jgi:hypothetical protein
MVNTPQINGWPSYTAARRDGPQNQQPYRGYRMRNASLAPLTARVTTLGALDEAKKSARASKSGAYIEIIGGKMDMPPALAYAMPTQGHVRRYTGPDRNRRWREQLGFRHLSAKGKLRVKLLPNFDASEWDAAVLTNRSPILLTTK